MNILIVSAHEDPKSHLAALHSVAIGALERQGHSVVTTELYTQQFNPVASRLDFNTQATQHVTYVSEQQRVFNIGVGFSPDIETEMAKVKQADIIIFHSQLWWGGVPAILKGWFDRVLAAGFAWTQERQYERGLLKSKKALLVVVNDGPAEDYTPAGKHRASLDQMLYPVTRRTLGACGMQVVRPYAVHGVSAANYGQLNAQLDAYRDFIQGISNNKLDYIYAP